MIICTLQNYITERKQCTPIPGQTQEAEMYGALLFVLSFLMYNNDMPLSDIEIKFKCCVLRTGLQN